MISVEQARAIIRQHAAPLGDEAMPTALAHGRVLREPVAPTEDLPPFDRSAMDGYAVLEHDAADQLEVVAEIRAGDSIDRQLKPGQAVRILTGARLPGPGLKVIMQEHVKRDGSRISVVKRVPASHVRRRGEDARAGEVLLKPGVTLEASALALLASMGKTSVRVSKLPRILHLTTGDEIVPPGQTPGPGQIRNSNASLIGALCRESGAHEVNHFHAPDELAELLRILSDANAETYDLILVSGGSGHGTYDFSADVFRQLAATIHFREVNVRPGKPLIFGTAARQVIFGLPGNALSHFACFHLFVRAALEGLLARPESTTFPGFLAEPMSDPFSDRETWWPASLRLTEGRIEASALAWKSSGDITRLPAAHALMKIPAATPRLDAGSLVDLLLTRNFPFGFTA